MRIWPPNPGVAVMRSERTPCGAPPRTLVGPSMRLTELAKQVLEVMAHVPRELLDKAMIHRSDATVLWFPWYPRKRGGGAFVVGRTIRFTSNWYAVSGPGAFGDGSRSSTQRWLLHLAHEEVSHTQCQLAENQFFPHIKLQPNPLVQDN